jgi:heptosyltransferase-2
VSGRRPKRVPLAQARRILVVRPDEIGDVILTSPFFRELRRAAPEAHIVALVKSACFELVEHCPYVNEAQVLDFRLDVSLRVRADALLMRFSRGCWRGFDLVLLPRWDHDYYDSELIAHLLAGRGAVVVHRDRIVSRDNWPEPPFAVEAYCSPQVEHEAIHPLRMLKWCGTRGAEDVRLEIWLTERDRTFARGWLANRFPAGSPIVVIHPSGGNSELKQWPLVRYVELINRLRQQHRFDFLVVGGPDESFITEAFAGEACDRVAVAPGAFTLRQLAAVLERAQLFVGGDSGPMHLAAAVQTPIVIGVFGPTSERRFGPWGRDCRIVSLLLSLFSGRAAHVLGSMQNLPILGAALSNRIERRCCGRRNRAYNERSNRG